MVTGLDFRGGVDEPMSRSTGPPEPRQHAFRWISADVGGPPEAGVTSDLLSEDEKFTLTGRLPRSLGRSGTLHGICGPHRGTPAARQRSSNCRRDGRGFQASNNRVLATLPSATIPPGLCATWFADRSRQPVCSYDVPPGHRLRMRECRRTGPRRASCRRRPRWWGRVG